MSTQMHPTSILSLDKTNKKVEQTSYKGTTNLGLCYNKSDQYMLKGYSDVGFAGDRIERKSISGICHFIGPNLITRVEILGKLALEVTMMRWTRVVRIWMFNKAASDMIIIVVVESFEDAIDENSCKLGEFLSAALWHHIGGALLFKEDTSLSDHLNEFQGIIDQMSRMTIKFEDEILGLLLLNSLLESWETFKISITNLAPNSIVSLQMVKGSVLNKEMRRKAQGSSSQSEVLVTENRGKSQKKEREKRISKSKSRYKNVECHYCHKTKHIQKHFFLWKKENKGKKGKSKEKDDDCVTTTTGDALVILRDFESVNFVSDESMWIIDSSATLHVTPRKELFTSYTAGDFGVLKMSNDGVTKVIDVGD
ncbi:hypothetical protein CR513_56558, partial [Mucuna pruriens]